MQKERNGYWMEVYSGIRFYPFDPREDEINIIDIAHALSNICRFSGHTKEFYSVAQHCILVSELCGEYKLEGLMHDASEAYLSDVPRPVKKMLPDYEVCEKVLQKAIFKKFKLHYPYPISVRLSDEIMLEREHRNVLNFNLNWATSEPNSWIHDKNFDKHEKIYNKKIILMPPSEAEKNFLELFEEYSNGR